MTSQAALTQAGVWDRGSSILSQTQSSSSSPSGSINPKRLILLVHHHLDDTHHLPNAWSNNIQILSPPNKLQLQHSMQLLHHLANPIGDLLVLIEHLHVNLLLHQHLNDNQHLQIALLASLASIELVSSSARVTSAKFQKALGCTQRHRDP